MLLRTAAILLLCASAGMCATLALHQTPEPEEESLPAAAAASVDGDGLGQVPAEEPQANPLPGGNQLGRTLNGSEPAAEGVEGNAPAADGATANQLETEVGDGPAGDGATRTQPSSSSADGGNDIRPVRSMMRDRVKAQEESGWSINSIRSSFQSAHGYFNSLVELVGGRNGVCQYRCRYGELPKPRPGYQLSQPDGCTNSLTGFQVYESLDIGIPAMTNCCNQLDTCYETCGTNKEECDAEFRTCLHGICSDINKSLGFESKVQACGSLANTLHRMVQTLGCRPYMNSQRAACFCEGEERDEL